MREKRNYKKLIASCVTMLCMAVMILTVFYTDASDESTAITYQEGYTWKSETYKDANGDGIAPTAPTGYLFAGWYTKEGTTYKAVSNPVEGENYCAKFVPEEVLGMKAQISKTLTDDNAENDGTTAAIRFVTSIDNSKTYKHVGFNIKKGSSGVAEDAKTTDYVYRTIYAVGATDSNGKAEDYVPEELFHEASYYFKTWTIGNIKEAAYNTEITVIPYWITLDGTRVEGTKAIKVATINLGRSWIYINETANEDGKQYGTKKHPYNDFATALDNIVLDKNGKILLQSDYTEASGFKWESHGKDITIAGVQGTETLDFSELSAGSINDGVAFSHMTLKLRSGNVYACGNDFTIASDVDSDNPNTVIYGGAYGTAVEKTNVTILAGNYRAIYGGGATGGTVTGDTHVKIENSNIYNTSTSHDSRVHGGGNKATVEGNTYVEIGDKFNAGLGNSYSDSTMHSTVYGGGYGESGNVATVKGDTKVVVKSGARVNYVFGAGGPQSAVEGTSQILFEGGYAMGLYGGANGSGTNSHTLVKMTGGQVEQIFGGNQSTLDNSMVGRSGEKVYADVQVLGGTVTRRIYGGCYNDYDGTWLTTNSVDGYSGVTIGTDAIISGRSDWQGDTSICATSRLEANATDAGEIGVMVLNPRVSSSTVGSTMSSYTVSNYIYTNFLVTVEEGGSVVAEQGTLHISASDTKPYATVKYGDEVLGVVKGEGKCPLPALKATNSVQEISVTFDTAEPDTTNFEAKNVTGTDVVYYPTFEEAMDMAEDGTNVVVLKDIEISETYTIADKLTISSEKEVTLTRASGVTGNLFEVTGELHISGEKNGNLILDGAYDDSVKDVVRAVNVASGATLDMDYATIQSFYTTGDGAAVYIHEGSEATLTECIFQSNQSKAAGGAIFIAKASSTDVAGKVTTENSSFIGNTATGNGGAIHCKGTYIDKNCNYTNNTGKNGGALVVFDGGSVSLTGNNESALFSNNKASGDSNSRGAAIFVNGSKSSIEVSGYVFDSHSVGKGIIHVISNGSASLTDVVFQDTNEVRTINVLGTLTFDNITGAILVQDSAGKICVAGYEETNALSITPYTNTDTYTVGHEVLVRAEGVEELVFEAACAGITVTPDGSDNDWWIKSDGTLVWGEVCIDTICYATLKDAVDAINEDDSIGETDNITIEVLRNTPISSTVKVEKNITIVNTPNSSMTISRASDMTALMFNVTSGASLTLGSSETTETGELTVDGYTASTIGTRIVENSGTFTLSRNAILTGANTNATPWGCALINKGTAHLRGSITDNTCAGACGAVLQHTGTLYIYEGTYTGNSATRSVDHSSGPSMGGFLRVYGGTAYIYGGDFTDNSTTGNGGAIYVDSGKTAYITGGTFSGNMADQEGSAICSVGTLSCMDAIFQGETEQTIYTNGTFSFDNLTGVTLVQGSTNVLKVAGYEEGNEIEVTPSTYEVGHEVLVKVDGVEDSVFEAACAGITVTPDGSDNDWWIKSDGTLVWGEACIDTTCYATLKDAVDAINEDDSIEETDNITIEVLRNTLISGTVKVEKNITIVNTPNSSMTISRASDMTAMMFNVTSGASLTLGSNETTESGELVVNGYTASTIGTRIVENSGTFTLSRNAILTGANTNATPWGCALINKGTAHLRGSITDNTCAGACGAVLQHTGTLYIYEGTYTGNSATRSAAHSSGPSMGGFLRVYGGTAYIYGGNFANNSTTGNGGAIYVDKGKTAYITGGTFLDNTAGQEGNDVYAAGTLNYTSSNVITSTDGIKGNGTINSDYSGQ